VNWGVVRRIRCRVIKYLVCFVLLVKVGLYEKDIVIRMKYSVVLFLAALFLLQCWTSEAMLKPHVMPFMGLYRHNSCPTVGSVPGLEAVANTRVVAAAGNGDKSGKVNNAAAKVAAKSSLVKQLGPVLLSALCVAALMYPLDLVRALQMANSGSGAKLSTMQLLSNFKDTHGIQGFFTQGLAPELARSTWMRLLKFGLFPIIHEKMTGLPEKAGTAGTKAVAAMLASVPEAVSIMPLEIAKISLQLDTSKRFGNSMFTAMNSVYNEKSLPGFAIGYLGIQARQALWTAGYFASIGYFEDKVNKAIDTINANRKDTKIDKSSKSVQVTSQLLSGFLAGVFGAVLNTPFDTIRTTIQKRMLSPVPVPGATDILGVAQEIVSARGVSGLYAGFQFKAFHLGGGGALMAFFVPFFSKMFVNM
jgi:solute carrier family 25 2-oxodicarboxylate transporter 21